MNSVKRILSVLLTVLLVMTVIPMSASAAPEVYVFEGENSVFVSGFGRLVYEGTTYQAFKNVEDAVAALGKDGGRIMFMGTLDMTKFVDTPGRSKLSFIGLGAKPSGAVLYYGTEAVSAEFLGDVYTDNLVIRTESDITIHTNGYAFETSDEFDSYYKETFVENGSNIITYPFPLNISTGNYNSDVPASEIVIGGGNIGSLVAGASGESKVNGDTSVAVCGGAVAKLVAGNDSQSAVFEGNSDILIKGGTISELVLGSLGGSTKANFVLTLDGGTVEKLSVGAEAVVDGNVVIIHKNGAVVDFSATSASSIKGKKILVHQGGKLAEQTGAFDYIIELSDSSVLPVFEAAKLVGFKVRDKNGFVPNTVMLDGKEISGQNGIYQLPEGKHTVSCISNAAVKVNKSASYVAGYEDGTFGPQKNITRAEAITLLARIIAEDISVLPSVVSTEYSDLAKTDWYYGVVAFFEGLGYLEKLEKQAGTIIDAKLPITRGEFAEIASNVLTEIYGGREFGIKFFSDVSHNNKFFDSIGQLGYLGVIGGYEDGTFGPERLITRAEVVTIVNRMLGRIPTGETAGTVAFSDIDGHWAKSQIVTACNPSKIGDKTIWNITEDITVGDFDLLEGDVTVGDQIRNLHEKASSIASVDVITGIDKISKWQIEQIVNAEDMPDNEGKTTYYISPNGNDDNDGKSPETAWKTLNKLGDAKVMFKLKAGDTIRFERGGEWRGNLVCRAGINYGAYGEGPKPIINASFKNYADPALWVETDVPGIWKCQDRLDNVGIIVYDYSGILGNYHENVGFLQVKNVNGFTGYKDLTKDLTFSSDLDTKELFVCSKEGNPGERFKSIEIGTCYNVITVQEPGNVVIDNLSVRFTGAHAVAIGDKENVTVQNCTFDYLGGSILRGYKDGNVRYGNALQVYGGCDGWYLYNNWMYQIYDTGVTHQFAGSEMGNCLMDNVKYVGNVIEYCHWSIEYYNPDNGKKKSFHNTYIADNICRMNGYGWGSQIRQSSAILFQSAGITENTKNFVTENNIFDRSTSRIFNCNSAGDKELKLGNNIYVQKSGNAFASFQGIKFDATVDVMERMKLNAKDTTSIFVFNNDTTINDYYIYPKK